MKTTVALTCLLFCSVATIPAAEAAQIKTATVTPHIAISHTNLGAHGAGGGGGGTGKNTASPYLRYDFKQVQVKTISWAH